MTSHLVCTVVLFSKSLWEMVELGLLPASEFEEFNRFKPLQDKIFGSKILSKMLASLAFCLEILLRKIPSVKGLNGLNSSSQTQMQALIWPFLKVTLKFHMKPSSQLISQSDFEKSSTVQPKWEVKWMSEFLNNSFHHFSPFSSRNCQRLEI